ncbi:exported hypothetical protein [Stenotrophomonas maltophilia]|nr:exported hypothetical protein [Stenotrophomonas maltophilia]
MHVAAMPLCVFAVVMTFMALVLAALHRRRFTTGFAAVVRFKLQCHVLDAEVIVQAPAQLTAQRIGFGAVAHHDMRGQRRRAGGQRPHVQVMHVHYRGMAGQAVAHLGHVHALGHAFQQHVDRLAHQHPGARQHPQADQHRQDRIDRLPAGELDQHRTRNHRHRAEHVRPHFQVGALHVEALAAAGLQQAHRDQVDDQAGRGDHQHAGGGDLLRLAEAPDGFPEDVAGNHEQHRAVDHRAQRFQARIAVGAARVRRATAQPHRDQRDHQGQRVGGHVCRVGQQRQAVGPERAHHFDDEEGGGQAERPPQGFLVADLGWQVIVVVAHGNSSFAMEAGYAGGRGETITVFITLQTARRGSPQLAPVPGHTMMTTSPLDGERAARPLRRCGPQWTPKHKESGTCGLPRPPGSPSPWPARWARPQAPRPRPASRISRR